jgi:hypothetical protein
MLGLAERAGDGNTAQHGEAKVVGVDGRKPIYEPVGFIVLIEYLPHEMDIVSK